MGETESEWWQVRAPGLIQAAVKEQVKELRKKVRTAEIRIVTFEVYCPYCYEITEESDRGSYQWEVCLANSEQLYTCSDCGKEFRLPASTPAAKL